MSPFLSWLRHERPKGGARSRVQEQMTDGSLYGVTGTTEDATWGRVGGLEEEYLWRRLSDNWQQKDVVPSTYLELHQQAYEAYTSNPLAALIIDTTANFVIGDGARVHARSKRVQRLLDSFWEDPENCMEQRQHWLCTELALYGELFIRFFVNAYDGTVKIALMDPSTIDQIACDPDNIERVLRVHRRGLDQPPAEHNTARTTATSDPLESGAWFSVPDEVMQFSINKVSNAKRGRSDLAVLLPWLRRYKDWLTDRVRINKYKGAFLYDVTLKGADKRTVDAKMLQYAAPLEPGSVIFHNESEVWQAVQPRIDADNVSADGRAIKLMIAAGAGLPEHYLSEGGNVNRATAAEMGLPTLKRFQRRQHYLRYLLGTVLDRVIDEALRADRLPAGIDRRYDIVLPALDDRDLASIAQATSTMTTALATARAQGWITDETAVHLLFECAGGQVDAAAEWARLHGLHPDTIGGR